MSDDHPLSAECRLVFRSADPGLEGAEVEALCRAVTDWTRVVLIADREMATAGVWQAIERAPDAPVPAAISEHLRGQALVSAFRMQHLSQRLRETIAVLRERGIPTILLKGAALGAMTDPTFRSRPMTDLDLLVHDEDADRARDAIVAAGWPQTEDPVLHELLRDAHHQAPFFDPKVRGLRLELHTRMLPAENSFAFEEEDLWRDSEEAPAPFDGARIPSVEHLILHASTHFAWSHSMTFGAWRTFRLLNALARAGRVDWAQVAAFARTSRAGTACYWTFRLSATLSGTAVPREVLERLAPPNPRSVQRGLERHFIAALAPGEGPSSPSTRLTYLLWRMALRPRWSGHRTPGRRDPENRWGKAMGVATTETGTERLVRHLAGVRRWWEFATRTFSPFS